MRAAPSRLLRPFRSTTLLHPPLYEKRGRSRGRRGVAVGKRRSNKRSGPRCGMLRGPAGGRRRHPVPSTGRCGGVRAGSRPAVPGAGGVPGTGWGGVLSKSVAKARIPPKRRKRNVDILRFFSRPIPARSAFATDLDKRRRRGPLGGGRCPSDDHCEAGTTTDPRSGGDAGPGGRRRAGATAARARVRAEELAGGRSRRGYGRSREGAGDAAGGLVAPTTWATSRPEARMPSSRSPFLTSSALVTRLPSGLRKMA